MNISLTVLEIGNRELENGKKQGFGISKIATTGSI